MKNFLAKMKGLGQSTKSIIIVALAMIIWCGLAVLTRKLGADLSGDEIDYFQRGLKIGSGSLSDGYRMPGFPVWISAFNLVVPKSILIEVLRFVNILAVALVPGLWWWNAEKAPAPLKTGFYVMGILTLLWPPFFLFSFSLLAEGLSFALLNLLVLLLFTTDQNSKGSHYLWMGLCLSGMFLLKANAILVSVPVFIFLLLTSKRRRRISLLLLPVTITVLAWILFLSSTTGHLLVSTNSGVNLLVGTGHYSFGMKPDKGAAPTKFLSGSEPNTISNEDIESLSQAKKIKEVVLKKVTVNQAAQKIAYDIWGDQTGQQIKHGMLKIIHTQGGSIRGIKDLITLFFFFAVLISSGLLFRESSLRRFVKLHWGFAFSGFFLAFFFLPNIRFKTFYFDTTGLFIIALLLAHFYKSKIETTKD